MLRYNITSRIFIFTSFIDGRVRHIRDIGLFCTDHESLWHVVRNADYSALLLRSIEKISSNAADGAFLNVEDTDNVVFSDGSIIPKIEIHCVTPP